MDARELEQAGFKLFTKSDRCYIHLASERAGSLRQYLREHSIYALYPKTVILGIHSMELPPDSDLTAVRLMIHKWAEDQIAREGPNYVEEIIVAPPRKSMLGGA